MTGPPVRHFVRWGLGLLTLAALLAGGVLLVIRFIVNTALEFIVLTAVLVNAAEWVDLSKILLPAYVTVTATIAASGLNYVWVWGRRARRSLRR